MLEFLLFDFKGSGTEILKKHFKQRNKATLSILC